MKYVTGIDIGTSGCKTVLLDETGTVAGSASKEYFAETRENGYAAQNPQDWYKAFVETLHEICRKRKISPGDIEAVCATGQMQGCTFLGKDGEAVRDSLLWYDTSPVKEVELFHKSFGDIFCKACNMNATTSLTGSKIKWVMNHEPSVWEKVYKFTFASCYITYRLTGNLTVDTNNLGLSGLNSVKDNGWSQELLELTGVEKEKVPDLTGCFDAVGTVSKKAAKETGLREGVIVIAGGGDGAAECYSTGIAGKSELKIRLGSAGDVAAVLHESRFEGGNVEGMRYVQPQYLQVGNYIKGCALSVKWIRDTFFSGYDKKYDAYSRMDALIPEFEAGTGGLMFHPYIAGENAPYFDADLKGKFTGISIAHSRGDFLSAAYEGISYAIRDLIESIPRIWDLEKIVIVGGGAKSGPWVRALTDVMGKNAMIPAYCDASLGAALMAGDGAGIFNSKEIVERNRTSGRYVEYSKERHSQYNGLFKVYQTRALI